MGNILYIAGPMASPVITEEQRETFLAAETLYTAKGWLCINPTVRIPAWMDRKQATKICTAFLDTADAILLLPGWAESEGSVVEYSHAKYTGKLILRYWKDTEPPEPEPPIEKRRAAKIIMDLHNEGGCGATEPYSQGWDDAITQAIEIVEKRTGVSFAEAEAMEG